MKCPKCGNNLVKDPKNEGKSLCYSCKKRMDETKVRQYWDRKNNKTEDPFAQIAIPNSKNTAPINHDKNKTENKTKKSLKTSTIVMIVIWSIIAIVFLICMAVSCSSSTDYNSNSIHEITNTNTNKNDNKNIKNENKFTSTEIDTSYIKPTGELTPGIWENNTILVGDAEIKLGETTLEDFGLKVKHFFTLKTSDYDKTLNVKNATENILFTDNLSGESTANTFTLQVSNPGDGTRTVAVCPITAMYTSSGSFTPSAPFILLDGAHIGDNLKVAIDDYGQPSEMNKKDGGITITYRSDNSYLTIYSKDCKTITGFDFVLIQSTLSDTSSQQIQQQTQPQNDASNSQIVEMFDPTKTYKQGDIVRFSGYSLGGQQTVNKSTGKKGAAIFFSTDRNALSSNAQAIIMLDTTRATSAGISVECTAVCAMVGDDGKPIFREM